MNDPYVQWLRYRIVTDEGVHYDRTPAAERRIPSGRVRIEDGIATIYPDDHYASEQDARQAIEPDLSAWQIWVGIQLRGERFEFQYLDANVVDRSPTPGSITVNAPSIRMSMGVGEVKVQIGRAAYPDSPGAFSVTPDLQSLWNRYSRYRGGAEGLLSMAYFCLTVVERACGSRGQAAGQLVVSETIPRTLGTLTSRRGDADTARKAQPSYEGLSNDEKRWIDAAVSALIRRMGERAARPEAALRQITMSDLPPLPKPN